MIETFKNYYEFILKAFLETIDMVLWASLLATIFGIFLGLILFLTSKNNIYDNKYVYLVISVITNIFRSVPFILLIIIIIPFNRLIVGTGFGPLASKVPLTLIATFTITRLSEQTFLELDKSLYETSYNLGANNLEYIKYFLFTEGRSSLILNIKTMIISTLAYSTVVGVIGGGGLGYLAINEGFTNFNYSLMWIIIIIMIFLVTIVESLFNAFAKFLDKR